ncbi:MAG: DNA-methyltransferase [Janthinobacterium lividum]
MSVDTLPIPETARPQVASRVLKTEPLAWRELRFIQQEDFKAYTSPEAKQRLRESLLTNSFVQPFNVWEDPAGVRWCLDGRHRVRELEELAAEGVEVPAELPGTFVACASKQDAAKLVLLYSSAYARATEQGLLDFAQLNDLNLADLTGQIDLPNIDLDKLLAGMGEPAEEQAFEPVLPPTPVSVLGDVYEFHSEGQALLHRLVCGSSTDSDVVARALGEGELIDLVNTDPPYNVDYEGKTKAALKIANDSMGDSDFYQFLRDYYTNCFTFMRPGAPIYVFHADTEGANFRRALVDAGLKLSQCLVWIKQAFVMGRQDYHWQHEPILYGWKEGAAHTWCSDRKQTTVLHFDRPSRNSEHPTMKPVDILEYLVECSSKPRAIVFDGFGGSGSVLITCEKTGRKARLVELDPRYVDVMVRRWAKFMRDNERPFMVLRNGEQLTEQQLAAYDPVGSEQETADICPIP